MKNFTSNRQSSSNYYYYLDHQKYKQDRIHISYYRTSTIFFFSSAAENARIMDQVYYERELINIGSLYFSVNCTLRVLRSTRKFYPFFYKQEVCDIKHDQTWYGITEGVNHPCAKEQGLRNGRTVEKVT